MKDFYFWLNLPYTLGVTSAELTLMVKQTQQSFHQLEAEIIKSKSLLFELLKRDFSNTSQTNQVEISLQDALQEIENSKKFLIEKSLNITHQHFQMISTNFTERQGKLNLSQLKVCMECCRTVFNKAKEEILNQPQDVQEKKQFLRIKNSACKSLKMICTRIENILSEDQENEEIQEDDQQLNANQQFEGNQSILRNQQAQQQTQSVIAERNLVHLSFNNQQQITDDSINNTQNIIISQDRNQINQVNVNQLRVKRRNQEEESQPQEDRKKKKLSFIK